MHVMFRRLGNEPGGQRTDEAFGHFIMDGAADFFRATLYRLQGALHVEYVFCVCNLAFEFHLAQIRERKARQKVVCDAWHHPQHGKAAPEALVVAEGPKVTRPLHRDWAFYTQLRQTGQRRHRGKKREEMDRIQPVVLDSQRFQVDASAQHSAGVFPFLGTIWQVQMQRGQQLRPTRGQQSTVPTPQAGRSAGAGSEAGRRPTQNPRLGAPPARSARADEAGS